MAVQRKLGRSSDQRKALLRNQVTNLLWYGRIETTLARAKEVRSIAEKMVTLAIREHENTVSATKEYHNDKGQIVTIDVVNDAPAKLHARRLMMAYLYEMPHVREEDETKKEYASAPRRTTIP
jgi:large subunit ribosomal protein L17